VISKWLERFPPKQIAPFLLGFAALSMFDIQIQWLASGRVPASRSTGARWLHGCRSSTSRS